MYIYIVTVLVGASPRAQPSMEQLGPPRLDRPELQIAGPEKSEVGGTWFFWTGIRQWADHVG